MMPDRWTTLDPVNDPVPVPGVTLNGEPISDIDHLPWPETLHHVTEPDETCPGGPFVFPIDL